MADEPRRSVRATKGQHTKNPDLLDQTPEPKKKTSKKSKKAEKEAEEPEAEIIRCVCGATETGDDEGEAWIACDNCQSWQHNVCVGVPVFEEDVPANYLCEQCDPKFHKELLDAIKRGEKIWEERRKRFEQEKAEEEQGGAKKKGKKKGKRTSDPPLEINNGTNGKAKSPSASSLTDGKKNQTIARAGSTKRKNIDGSQEEPQSKVRKVSAAPRQETPTNGLPVKIIDLETARQGGAKLIQKGLLHAIPIALNNAIYVLAKGDTVDTKAERLAIEVEDAVHKTHADKAAYNKQARALFNNLKQNQELCNGLLTRSLSPAALAVMTTDDMASKELKKETAEMKARADKQSIMVTDDGPRIRRTHKGEEMIESDNFAVSNDSTMSTARRRSMLDPNADMATRSRENSPGDEVELPASIGEFRSQDDIRGHTIPKQPLNIETKVPVPTRKASTQPDFDINRVFSSVQSPVTAQHVRRPSMNNAPPAGGPGVDPEIDKMLQDDDGNESPPYSPAEYSSDPDIVWRGNVAMDAIAKFPAVAKHIAGADISRSIPWTSILQKDLKVAGRIDQEKANEYLCSLRYSPPTDVVVVNLTPTGEAASQGFIELYEYFQSKSRYGVLTNKGVGNIRDTYLVPVPPSPGNLPDFIINLEGHKVPEDRPSPMVLVALVIRSEWQPESHRGTDNHSPSVPSHPQRQMSISGAGPQMSPIQAQGAFASPPQAPPQMTPQQIEEKRARDQREGELNGIRILGPHKDAPTVAFLMPHAYQMRPIEWQIVRSILEEDERARVDLQHLSQMIEIRNAQT